MDMINHTTITVNTTGEGFTDTTFAIQEALKEKLLETPDQNGLLNIFVKHTSCALTINEAYDPSAREDLESFLRHLAPTNLKFIKHTDEGPDDSPSHMKTLLTQTSLSIPVIAGKMQLGTWQGIYLCEFRRDPKKRTLLLSFH